MNEVVSKSCFKALSPLYRVPVILHGDANFSPISCVTQVKKNRAIMLIVYPSIQKYVFPL